jgi:hypothetical protein
MPTPKTRRDYGRIAEGLGLGIPQADLAKLVPILEALETAFRPLAERLPSEVEPAVKFECPPEEKP